VGQVIPLMGLQVRVIDPRTASNPLEGPTCEDHHAANWCRPRRQPCSRQATITGAKKNRQRDRNINLLFAIRRTIGNGILDAVR
jgi:hypothetical protein